MAARWTVTATLVVVWVALALPVSSDTRAEKCSLTEPGNTAPPDFTEPLKGSYSLTVEMTSEMEFTTYYVEEVHERHIYHDQMTDTVGVTVRYNGTTTVYQYYPESDVMVQEYGGVCQKLSSELPTFPWGWKDVNETHGPKSFGPSSILRLASFLPSEKLMGNSSEEGVDVEMWTACADDNDVKAHFHYSKPPWLMPEYYMFEGQEGQLPVSMMAEFMNLSERWKYAFVDFVPYVRSHHSLEPPRGMSCEGMVGVLNGGPVPTIPHHFSLAEEIILNPVIDGQDFGTQHMDKVQMTYAGEISLVSVLASLPYDNEHHTAFAIKIIHDFNTGVQYTIFKEFGNCSKEPIPPYTFDSHYGGFLGTGDNLLSPNDMFHLDDKFAFVGERESRDIPGDLWTSTRLNDIPDPSTGGLQNLAKAVLEYYFSQGLERTSSGYLLQTDLPFRGDLFAYNKSDPTQIVGTMTTNFYDFRVLDVFSPEEFSVEECYERYDDNWSYLDIIFPAKKSYQMEAANEEQDRFKHEVMVKIIEIGNVSPVRIASIDVTTGVSGVIPNATNADIIVAKVKLLERAPYIFSYRQPADEVNPKPGKNQVMMANLRSREDCAAICSTDTDVECKSFHHCMDYKCYFSKLEGADGELVDEEQPCEHWVYDLNNKTVEDYPSETVYKEVFDAIKIGTFVFEVPYKNNTVQVGYEASMSLHYRTPDPLDPMRSQFSLESTRMTVEHPNDTIQVDDLTECMLLCVGWVRYRCETLVYQVDEGLCLLLATHFHELADTELVPHSNSFIHSRNYLVDYSPILGGVVLNSTGPTYFPVEHLEGCAWHCSTEWKIDCQSFEYCPSNQMCYLHAEHFLDVAHNGDYTNGTACVHFSRKTDSMFTVYEDQGLAPSQHRLEAHLTSPSACAKLCIDDSVEVCQSFDFCMICDDDNVGVCGADNQGREGVCFLATHHLGEAGLSLTTGKGCDHYDRDLFGDQDYASWVAQQLKADKPYTPGDMAGLAFGMIFLGVVLVVAFLAAITFFRPNSLPAELELSFQKLKTSGDSTI